MSSRRTVLGLSSVVALSMTVGCLRSVRDRFESEPDVPLGRIVVLNGTEADRTGELVVVRDDEIDLWQTFSVDGKDGQTVYSERIPAAELGEPTETYQIGANVEDIGIKWFDLADGVAESTLKRCREEDESVQFYIDIRTDDWIGYTAACE